MEEILDFIESIRVLGQSISILAVAPEYGAGELSPQSYQRVAEMIVMQCDLVKEKINQLEAFL
ncbi:MAG: hypothetical protein M0P73_07610 [Syntrophobacterales bacterium]|jgi:hypothetical protein|nr:hypothetical protein [Syntrophobacterales bacterium]